MALISRLISIPPFGRLALRFLKNRAFRPYQIPMEKTVERQQLLLKDKLRRIGSTKIGKKLGVNEKTKLSDLPLTDYDFYEPFYKKPSPEAFMFPLDDYLRMSTSGTSGTEKFYLFPRTQLKKTFREITPHMLLGLFHDGEKINLEYGDRIYINVGPAPFFSGSMVSLNAKKVPLMNLEPNVNLPYSEKVQYFIRNYEDIDGAFMMGSTLISQIMPAIGKPINLKGFATQDTPEIEAYRTEIEEFTGTIPKSFYGSTETHNCSVMSIQHSMCFFFDWRRGFLEFLPAKDGKIENSPVTIDEVNVGETYQLVFTHFENELTRFNTKDIFRCIAKGDDILHIEYPIFRFNGRLDKIINIQNFTRIDEQELLEALNSAGIPFIEFTARLKTKEGLGYVAIYIELKKRMKPKDVKDAIHEQLYKIDNDYQNLVNFFNYKPIEVNICPNGVFAEYLRKKEGSAPKVDRINMDETEFQHLTQLIAKQK